MSDITSGILTIVALVGALALVHVPLGNYMAAVFTSSRHLRAERAVYRVAGVDPSADQKPMAYALSAVGFSAAGIVFLYAFLRLQSVLPWSRGLPGMAPTQSFNTAISFVTNTNWQSYSGESTLGYLVQAAGLAVQNFASAAVGLGVAIALVRGLARSRSDRIGNFWVDLVRGIARILLPLSLVAAVVLVARGVVQNVTDTPLTTLAGHPTTIPGGPVASQEAIKEVGTNGGGYFNANSAHPYENPDGLTDILEIFLLLLIPSALPRTFGRMVGDTRQGVAILAVMTTLWGAALALVTWAEVHGPGLAPAAAGAAMEGKETRFGEWASALFATSTTGTSTGAVNSLHDSLTAPGGGVVLLNILLGEVAPGGVGSGLYGMLVMAVVTVFLAGLMVGRTPEYLGKKISRQQITLVALYVLATPALVLVGTGIAMGFSGPRASMLAGGPHGLSEVMYAFSSAANNNGSAFGGLSANTPFYNVALGLAMLFGRFVPLILVVALAGSFARQPKLAASSGTMPTHSALFAGLLVGVVLILTGLTYFPALALGPIVESLS